MTTPTKGPYARKRWAVVETKEAVRADGSKRLTVCLKRMRDEGGGGSLGEKLLEERNRKRFLALAKEAYSLNPEPPPTTKSVRAAKIVVPRALSEAAVAKLDYGTCSLIAMIPRAVLREDDRQKSHAPLSGREGRARVDKLMDKRMFAPGTWPEHFQVFTTKGMRSGPSKRMETVAETSESEDESESSGEDGGVMDTWYQCEACQKWRNVGNGCQLAPHATFFCADFEGHTCATPEEPYD
jgi:hypothetical protein